MFVDTESHFVFRFKKNVSTVDKIDCNFGNLKFETPKPLFGVNKALIRRKKQKKLCTI